jgi:cytosine/creatinine deaminase
MRQRILPCDESAVCTWDAHGAFRRKAKQAKGYGIAPGCRAEFVRMQAHDPVEAIRLRATRLKVFRAGSLIAETPAATAALHLDGRPPTVDWTVRRVGV